MAVALVAERIQRFVGLSTDTKPSAPPVGSIFYETDTGAQYIYDGAAWKLYAIDTPGFYVARGNWNFTDDGGATGAFTVFTVTGDVLLQVLGVCNIALLGATATIQLGVAGNTAVLIALTTATDLIANEIWHDATPTTTVEQIDLDGARMFVVTNGQDVILTKATAALTAGDIDFYGLWRPLSADGLVVPA